MGINRHDLNIQHLRRTGAKLLYVTTSKYEGDWHSIPHIHNFTELFFVIRGDGNFVIEDKIFPVTANDLVIINPNVEHTEKSRGSTPLEYTVFGIDGLAFTKESQPDAPNYSIHNYSNDRNTLLFFLKVLLNELEEKEDNYELVCQNILEVLLVHIMRSQNLGLTVPSPAKISKECGQIKRYLDSNYSDNITLDSLADMTHMNKFHMVHTFAKETGISPINYLIERRIKASMELLTSTNHSISQIASLVGFSSQSYFSQMFKKATGQTPNEYRKSSVSSSASERRKQ